MAESRSTNSSKPEARQPGLEPARRAFRLYVSRVADRRRGAARDPWVRGHRAGTGVADRRRVHQRQPAADDPDARRPAAAHPPSRGRDQRARAGELRAGVRCRPHPHGDRAGAVTRRDARHPGGNAAGQRPGHQAHDLRHAVDASQRRCSSTRSRSSATPVPSRSRSTTGYASSPAATSSTARAASSSTAR